MRFKHWLLIENTIAQELKTMNAASYKAMADSLASHFGENTAPLVSNYIIHRYITEKPGEDFTSWAKSILIQNKDFIAARIQQIKQKLNDPSYSTANLKQDNEEYHYQLMVNTATGGKNLRKGPSGLEVVNIQKALAENKQWDASKWAGWKWVSLGRGVCPEEGAAAGHCGNIAFTDDDNLFSLRDPRNRVHLTFVVNNGVIGEAKGINNEKPDKFYHPAIFALLMSSYITGYTGGGYAPTNNFNPEDLKYIPEIYDIVKNKLDAGSSVFDTAKNFYKLSDFKKLTLQNIKQMSPEDRYNLIIRALTLNLKETPNWFWHVYDDIMKDLPLKKQVNILGHLLQSEDKEIRICSLPVLRKIDKEGDLALKKKTIEKINEIGLPQEQNYYEDEDRVSEDLRSYYFSMFNELGKNTKISDYRNLYEIVKNYLNKKSNPKYGFIGVKRDDEHLIASFSNDIRAEMLDKVGEELKTQIRWNNKLDDDLARSAGFNFLMDRIWEMVKLPGSLVKEMSFVPSRNHRDNSSTISVPATNNETLIKVLEKLDYNACIRHLKEINKFLESPIKEILKTVKFEVKKNAEYENLVKHGFKKLNKPVDMQAKEIIDAITN